MKHVLETGGAGFIGSRFIHHVLKYRFDAVDNFPAEIHVGCSVEAPDLFLPTNTLGAQALLERVRCWWADASFKEGGRLLWRGGT